MNIMFNYVNILFGSSKSVPVNIIRKKNCQNNNDFELHYIEKIFIVVNYVSFSSFIC